MRYSILFLILLPSAAHAQSNYQPYLLGLRTAGMGGASVAFGKDSAMPWRNPAGIAHGDTAQFGLASNSLVVSDQTTAEYFGLSDDYRRSRGILPGDFRSTIDGSATSVFPNSITFTVPLGDDADHFFSLAFIAPMHEVEDSVADITLDTGGGFSLHQYLQTYRELRTYAFGPGYAVRLGDAGRLGIGAFFRYTSFRERSSEELSAHSLEIRDLSLDVTEYSALGDSFDLDMTAGLQLGPFAGFSLGLAAHGPSIGLLGQYSERSRQFCGDCVDPGTVEIHELDATGDTYELRTPPWFTAGLGYELPRTFAIAIDVSYWLPLDPYATTRVDAYQRAVLNDPAQPSSETPLFGLELLSDRREAVLNFNVGAEVYVNDRIAIRGGFFTDFSSEPELPPVSERTSADLGRRRIDRLGGSLGAAYEGSTTSFQIGLTYLGGLGELVGFEFGVDPEDRERLASSLPTRELASNVYMLSFSGQIDVGEIVQATSAAVTEELSAEGGR